MEQAGENERMTPTDSPCGVTQVRSSEGSPPESYGSQCEWAEG